MARFVYEAKKTPAETVRGVISAENKNAAMQKIGQMGYYLLSLTEEGQEALAGRPAHFMPFTRTVGLKEITTFTRQLSDLLESGLTIARALDILRVQSESKAFQRIIADLEDHCVSGNAFSDALARYPHIFSNLYVSMVRSGETGGMLEGVLKRIADFNEKQLELRTKVTTALAYPILMSVVGCATIFILMTFVIPKMMAMFTEMGQALPLPTQILVAISNVIAHYWILIIAGIGMGIVAFGRWYASRDGRYTVDRLVLRVPLVGALARKIEIARFARTLATLLHNGVPMLESLKIVAGIVENAVIRADLEKAYDAVREGSGVAKALTTSTVMPVAAITMISVGEEGGHLERSLVKVAEGYERESDETIKIVMSLLEPVMILTLGIIVGFIVIAMLLPIFEINFLVR